MWVFCKSGCVKSKKLVFSSKMDRNYASTDADALRSKNTQTTVNWVLKKYSLPQCASILPTRNTSSQYHCNPIFTTIAIPFCYHRHPKKLPTSRITTQHRHNSRNPTLHPKSQEIMPFQAKKPKFSEPLPSIQSSHSTKYRASTEIPPEAFLSTYCCATSKNAPDSVAISNASSLPRSDHAMCLA